MTDPRQSLKDWYAARDAEIVRRADTGEDPGVIGLDYNLGRIRVLQIVRQAHPILNWREEREADKALTAHCLLLWDTGHTYAQIGEELQLRRWQVQARVAIAKRSRAEAGNRYAWMQEFADSERELIRDLLWEGIKSQNWSYVREALETLDAEPRAAYKQGFKRQGGTDDGLPDTP
jgi:hypothetical protein